MKVTSNIADLDFDYDITTRKFTIERDAEVSKEGIITTSIARSNTYIINISYPLEAYRLMDVDNIQIDIPVSTYYAGFNNPNREFTNPYRSSAVSKTLTCDLKLQNSDDLVNTIVGVAVGKYVANPEYRYVVSKQKPMNMYNGISSEENDDTYTVRWNVSKGRDEVNTGLIMREVSSDKFVKADSTKVDSLSSYVGIGFLGADNFLNDDGYIKVYDNGTNEVLMTFTKDNWGKYTEENPYRYSLSVKDIRIETSETKDKSSFYVYNVKEFDDNAILEKYTKEEFVDLHAIESNVSIFAGDKDLGSQTSRANYEVPYSVASIKLSKSELSTQETENNEKITIVASCDEASNQVAWKNGSFLVKLPDEIVKTEINDISISNRNVSLSGYGYIENENGKFIKIDTKNSTPQIFNIVIDVNITPDSRVESVDKNIELWAINDGVENYYYNAPDIYDVNNNLDIDEKANKTSAVISLVAPNTLLTSQTASNYDSNNSIVVAPQVAEIEKTNQDTTVKIGVQIKNNNESAINEVAILGKIPFEGNTAVISGDDLNSDFTTNMVEGGLEIPAELQGKVKVYYSENGNADRDLNKEENGWRVAKDVENWENVKTFLVDFMEEEIAEGKEYTFYYIVVVSNGVNYGEVAYSTYGAYFALDTEEKDRKSVEPSKLGISVSENFELEIQQYQQGKDVAVFGATYKITDEQEENSTTIITNESGLAVLENLRPDRVYRIEELKAPDDYELNSEVVRFIGRVDENGALTVETLSGSEVALEDGKVVVRSEVAVKARLKIIKVEEGTDNKISGVHYKIYGEGLPETGRTVITDENGEINVSGLRIGVEYRLKEIKADGYFLTYPMDLLIRKTEDGYLAVILDDDSVDITVNEENGIPVVTLKLEDRKMPTYNLELTKIKKITPVEEGVEEYAEEEITYLAGAKFKLYKGTKEIGEYTTDENGKLVINNLCPYVGYEEEEYTEEEYLLREVVAPEGYARVKDIKFIAGYYNEELHFYEFVEDGQTAKEYEIEENTIKLLVEDSPAFKLINKDGETGELLANNKFAIYNVDSAEVPARDSKGEIVGTREIIDGKEYYVVTTNAVGEITVDLPEGLYKALEVEADDKYDLSNSVYYFGIGASSEGKIAYVPEWAKTISESTSDYTKKVVETSDGGYIVGGHFSSSSIDLGNGFVLKNTGSTSYTDGFLIKYSAEGEIEWTKVIGGTNSDYITSIVETNDGGYAVAGYFKSFSINLGNEITIKIQEVQAIMMEWL